MDITFIVTEQQSLHEGVVRPFVNFAKALGSKYKVSFLLLNCGSGFVNQMKKNPFQLIVAQNKNQAVEELKRIKPRFIFIDDDLNRLKLTRELKKQINTKTACYIQVLYGSHAIADCFDHSTLTFKEKMRFSPLRYVPFSFFSNRYSKQLRTFDVVIANSKVTATFLHSLYNVEVSGIIYPPVDTDIFQPSAQKSEKEITLYLGSHLGDVNKQFVKKIVEEVTGNGYLTNLFGNAKIASEITHKNNQIQYYANLTDSELAQMYSRSKLTVCPQKWEQFGLVPVESMACGTPVLAFNCMGFQETIDSASGWLGNNEKDFLQILRAQLRKTEFSSQTIRKHVTEAFSIEASGKTLEEILEKYFN